MPEFGQIGVIAVAALAIVVAAAGLLFGVRRLRRRKGGARRPSAVLQDKRIEVLDTTIVDAERRLVLVRCDRIEHLIMIGGPTDLVVENDVRKVRGGASAPAKPSTTADLLPRTATAPTGRAQTPASEPAKPAEQRPPESRISDSDSPGDVRPPANTARASTAPRPNLSAVPLPSSRPAARNGGARNATAGAKNEEAARTAAQRQAAAESQFGRRENQPQRRTPQVQPAPIGGKRSGSSAERSPSQTVARERSGGGLPSAEVPWAEPGSIENDIVQALRFEPRAERTDQPARQEPQARDAKDPTTLGDLAERLEEALAREVQSASKDKRSDVDFDFNFDRKSETEPQQAKPRAEPRERTVQKERPPQSERGEPAKPIAAAPEPEAKREVPASERREEAPVISLNARRREAIDPLEDEMARLLGELTGDTKGR